MEFFTKDDASIRPSVPGYDPPPSHVGEPKPKRNRGGQASDLQEGYPTYWTNKAKKRINFPNSFRGGWITQARVGTRNWLN